MTRYYTFIFLTLLIVGAPVLSTDATAHSVVIDGQFTEWNRTVTTHANGGQVFRKGGGDFAWLDASADANSALNPNELSADMRELRITGSPTGIHVLWVTGDDPVNQTQIAQLVLAIDTDQQTSSGSTQIPNYDTSVSTDAAFEHLVRTQLHAGNMVTVTGTTTSSHPLARRNQPSETLIEFTIPWSAIGFTATTHPENFRFTAVVGKTDNAGAVLNLGGAAESNVVDAMTDYGDPSQAPHPTTSDETSDQVVDYFVDLFLPISQQSDVSSPVLIERFMPNSGGTEFVVLRNISTSSVALSEFAIGDEETVDSGEAMMMFPMGVTLTPGQFYEVANDGLAYQTMFARLPNAEILNTTAVSDMRPFPAWANGTFNLANGGDHLVLLSSSRTVLDVTNYGAGSYPGMIAIPPPSVNDTVVRVGSDTDNMIDDFVVTPYCLGDGDCGSCQTCDVAANYCVSIQCPDTQTVCQIDVCNPASGLCETMSEPNGTFCDDGVACTENDACQLGACQGSPIDCSALDTACKQGTCDEAIGGCVREDVTDGTLCDDGDPCTLQDACTSGSCASVPKDCGQFGDACNEARCDAITGACFGVPKLDGTLCEDGNLCTHSDACTAGACIAIVTDCSGLTDVCNDGFCDSTDGLCKTTQLTGGCDDDNICTENDRCQAGACTGTPVSVQANCGDACNFGLCDPTNGSCDKTPKPDGTDCDDLLACTTGDSCVGGACLGSTASNGAECDDGDRCTVNDVCFDGECTAGPDFDCSELDSECGSGFCTELGCKVEPVVDGTPCGDKSACSESNCIAGECVQTTACTEDVGFDIAIDFGSDTDELAIARTIPAGGCATGGQSSHGWMLFFGLFVLLRRRRR